MSISLVFLLATILTFVLQKSVKVYPLSTSILLLDRSLWTMHNYIHCMLCGSMFTALLVFIVGVEKTENEVKSVLLSSL